MRGGSLTKQAAVIVVAAVVLFVVAVGATLAFMSTDSSGGNVHTMPGGQSMTGMEMMSTTP
jgi:hypothetical protein